MTCPAVQPDQRPAAPGKPRPPRPLIVHPAENAAECRVASPLMQLLTGQILREGEIIEMVMRPSIWWVAFTCWRWVGVCVIIALAGLLLPIDPVLRRTWVELVLLAAAARVVWGLMKWMSRLHILTSLRVLTFSGVFNTAVYECPLRKVARLRMIRSVRERLLLLGSIELIPAEEEYPIVCWQVIPRPREVHEKLSRAVQRAKEGPTL